MAEGAFRLVRRVVVFCLGVWVIVEALVDSATDDTIPLLIIGSVLVGALPLDDLIPWRRRRHDEPEPPA